MNEGDPISTYETSETLKPIFHPNSILKRGDFCELLLHFSQTTTMAAQNWKFRKHWNGTFNFDPQEPEASSSDSDTCGSSHASGWEAASSSAPSPNRRQLERPRRDLQGNPWRGSVRRAGERVYFGWDSSSSSGAEDNNSSMTTASELLYQRRSRAGRSAELPLPEASRRLRPSSNSHLHRFHYSDHYDPNYHHYYHCHGSLRFRNFLQRVSEMDDQSQLSEQSSSSSLLSDETNRGRNRIMNFFAEQNIENNSLRGAMMQARNNLYERLRASSLERNRHNSTGSTVRENLSSRNAGPWETEVNQDRAASRNRWFEDELMAQFPPLSEPKPQGLSQKGISNLPKELFAPRSATGNKGSKEGSSALEQEDCPVCLEHFLPGEQLIRLGCRHRFHPVCLNPWLKICGDCPYCRANVLQYSGSSVSQSSSREAT